MQVPQEWRTLAADIVDTHGKPVNLEVQTAIFKRCMQVLLLGAVKDEIHLFCQEPLKTISGHMLIMFSFPGIRTTQRLDVEDRIARSLLQCCHCVRAFYTSLSELRSRFVLERKVLVALVVLFLDLVNDWVFLRLEPLVLKSVQATNSSLIDAVRLTLYECLSNVALLRSKPNFRGAVANLILASGKKCLNQPTDMIGRLQTLPMCLARP